MTSYRDPVQTGALRLRSRDGKYAQWAYVKSGGGLEFSSVNTEARQWVPHPQTPLLTYFIAEPAIEDGSYPQRGVAYSRLRVQMDGELGLASSVRSLNGATVTNVIVRGSDIQFSYQYDGPSDRLEITSWNRNGTDSRRWFADFDLVTVKNYPSAWAGTVPNTKGYTFHNLQMSFQRPVVAFGAVTSLYGSVGNLSLVDSKIQFSYSTGMSATDVLTFNEVYDGSILNDTPVTFSVANLQDAPTVSGFAQAPTSQLYASPVTVTFSKAIDSCTVNPSLGFVSTVSGFGTSQLSFTWTTGSSASQTLTFNNLVAADGSLDAGAIETIGATGLAPPPGSATWFNNPPLDPDVIYTGSSISLDTTAGNPPPSITCSIGANNITNVRIEGGKIVFDVATSGSQVGAVYTLTDVYSSLGGIKSSMTLTLGPSVTDVLVSPYIPFAEGQFLNLGKVVQGKDTLVYVGFSETLLEAPTLSLGALHSFDGASATYLVNSSLPIGEVHTYTVSSLNGPNATTPSDTFNLETVPEQTIAALRENGGLNLTAVNIGQAYSLTIEMGKSIDIGAITTLFDGAQVARQTDFTYTVTWTPSGEEGTRTIYLTSAKDHDSFIYDIPRSLTFTEIVDFITTFESLVVQYDATKNVTLEGDKVVRWDPAGGSSTQYMDQQDAASRPSLTTVNGRQALSFSGGTQHLTSNGRDQDVQLSTIVAVYSNTSTAWGSTAFSFGDPNGNRINHGGDPDKLFLANQATLLYGDVRIDQEPITVINNGNPRSLVADIAIQCHTFSSPLSSMTLNTVGSEFHAYLNRSIVGAFCELAVFSPALSATQLIDVENHLIAKWGIVV